MQSHARAINANEKNTSWLCVSNFIFKTHAQIVGVSRCPTRGGLVPRIGGRVCRGQMARLTARGRLNVIKVMRRYTYIVTKKTDGTWIAYFPGLPKISPVGARSKRQVRKMSFRALISFLQTYVINSQRPPKDIGTTYFHQVDVNRLDQYVGLDGDSMIGDLC